MVYVRTEAYKKTLLNSDKVNWYHVSIYACDERNILAYNRC